MDVSTNIIDRIGKERLLSYEHVNKMDENGRKKLSPDFTRNPKKEETSKNMGAMSGRDDDKWTVNYNGYLRQKEVVNLVAVNDEQ